MFTAAALAILTPILSGTTIGQAVAFLSTPAGKAARKLLKELFKSIGKPLTPEQQVKLARENYANRFALTKKQYWDYVLDGQVPAAITEWEKQQAAKQKQR